MDWNRAGLVRFDGVSFSPMDSATRDAAAVVEHRLAFGRARWSCDWNTIGSLSLDKWESGQFEVQNAYIDSILEDSKERFG